MQRPDNDALEARLTLWRAYAGGLALLVGALLYMLQSAPVCQ